MTEKDGGTHSVQEGPSNVFFLVLVDRSSDTDTKSFYEAFRT